MRYIEKKEIIFICIGVFLTAYILQLTTGEISPSGLIACFLILFMASNQVQKKANVCKRSMSQVIGIPIGIMLAYTVSNDYIAVGIIALLALYIPYGLGVGSSPLTAAIAASVIYYTAGAFPVDSGIERAFVNLVGIGTAIVVGRYFLYTKNSKKTYEKIQLVSLRQLGVAHVYLSNKEVEEEAMKKVSKEIKNIEREIKDVCQNEPLSVEKGESDWYEGLMKITTSLQCILEEWMGESIIHDSSLKQLFTQAVRIHEHIVEVNYYGKKAIELNYEVPQLIEVRDITHTLQVAKIYDYFIALEDMVDRYKKE